MKRFGFPLLLAAIVGLMLAIFWLGNRPPAPLAVTNHENQGQEHIAEGAEHIAYNSNPPSSGPHYAQPADWGVKDSEIADETLVHNLEHGGILILYKPGLSDHQLTELKQIAAGLPQSGFGNIKVILAPRAKNDRNISLVAWTVTYHLDQPDEKLIRQFYETYVDKGPEQVP